MRFLTLATFTLATSISKLFLLFLVLSPSISMAFKFTPEVCREYGLGKNWYCDEEKKEKVEEDIISAKDIMESNMLAEEKATQLNQLWETQRKRAVITGSKDEIQKFLETHYLITDKGINFAKKVQKIISSDPKLSESESYYKNASEAQLKDEEKESILKRAGKRYGLVFVYSIDCKYCARQLPIIYKFKQANNIKVMGVTSSEEYFPGLDENITDINIANDPLVKSFPTILLLDKKNPKKLFIAKGLTTLSDLEDKIVDKIKENEDEIAGANE